MNKLKSLPIEAYLVFCFFVIITAGDPFLSSKTLSHFGSNPKIHRLLLSVITFSGIVAFAMIQTKLKEESFIFNFFRKLNISFKTWVWMVFVFLSFVFSYSSYIRHHVFASSFDFAIFSQAIWNTWHGSFLHSSIKGGICLLGDHVSPFLALLAPFFSFGYRPELLLIAQAIAAASAVFPIYLIGKVVLKEEKLSFLCVISLALYLPLRNSVRFDFHPEIFAIPFFLWAFYWLIINRLVLSSIALALVISTKEVACIPVAFFALYSLIFQRKILFGFIWFLLSIFIFYAEIHWISPYFSKEPYFYLRGNFSAWKMQGIVPFLKFMVQSSSLTYLKKIFLPVGLFSILSPSTAMLTVPSIFQNLSARNEMTRSIFFHYTAYLTPFVFISAIYGFRNFIQIARKKFPVEKVKTFAAYWLIGWSLLLTGISEYHVILQYQTQNKPHYEYIRNYLKTVPSNISVRTHEFFAPHIANRKELHIYENNHPREGGSSKAQNAEYVIIDQKFIPDFNRSQINDLKSRGYLAEQEHDGFYVLIRRTKL